jgi:hypothetical protein
VANENARRTEHAWVDRAQESAAHQAAAAGMGPPPGLGGTRGTGGGGRSAPVHITGASPGFLDQVRQTWGVPGGGPAERANAHDPVLQDQRALNEMSRQMVDDFKTTARMVLDHQASAARAMSSLAQDMRTMRQEERDHMMRILDMLSSHSEQQLRVAESIQAAWAGVGATPAPASRTSGGPSPRRPRTRQGPVIGAYSTPTGIGTVHAPPFVPTPTPSGMTPRMMRRNLFNAVNQRYGIPAANAAQTAPTGMQSLVSNVAGPMANLGLRGIPVVGAGAAVLGGVFDAAEWLTEQRAANAQYQQIYSGDNFGLTDTIQSFFGGDANTGSGQRAAGLNFRLSQMFSHGGLTGPDADRLFQGVSALGYNNDQRKSALQFATGMYKQEGMSVDDSMKLIDSSARFANQSLTGVAESLTEVSKAAQETGQSAKALRDVFTTNYTSALAGGAGASAAPIAQAMTLSTAGISRQLAGANLTPMLNNPMYMQQIATGAGMTPGQLQSQMAQGNFRAFTGSAQKILDQRMLGVMDPQIRTKFQSLVKEYGGNEAVAEGPGAISGIAIELMGERGWNVYAARSALQSIGVDTSAMNDQQVTEFFVAQMTSGGIDAQAKQKEEENKPQDLGKQREEFGGVTEFDKKYMGVQGANRLGKEGFKAYNEYKEYREKTGQTDPAMEAAISQFGGQKVKVQTKQGPRVVTMGEAIRDYADQISSGSAIMAEGEHEGKKVSEVTGVTTTGVVPGKNGVPNTAKENAKSGQTVDQFEQGKGLKEAFTGGEGGVLRVEPSPELARLFNFSTTGNITVNESAAQGVPPVVNGPIR